MGKRTWWEIWVRGAFSAGSQPAVRVKSPGLTNLIVTLLKQHYTAVEMR